MKCKCGHSIELHTEVKVPVDKGNGTFCVVSGCSCWELRVKE